MRDLYNIGPLTTSVNALSWQDYIGELHSLLLEWICTHLCSFTHVHVHKQTCSLTNSHTHTHMHTYTHTCTHTHTHTHTLTGGIIQHHCNNVFYDHAIQIVGYDTTNTVPYWIIRNTWGTDWGEKGYVRIKLGDNMCGE